MSMEDFIKLADDFGCMYSELRTIESEKTSIVCSNNKITEISKGTTKSYGVRILYNNKWGNAFGTRPDKKLIKNAIKNAKIVDKKTKIQYQKPINKKFKTKRKINLKYVSLEEKKKDILSIRHDKKYVKNITLKYIDNVNKIKYWNSENSILSWDDTNIIMVASAYAQKLDRFESFYDVIAKKSGYEESESFYAKALDVANKATELLTSSVPKGGFYPALVDPKLCGVFAHECVGHACEADLIMNGTSILKDRLGNKIGPSYLSIYDDGSIENNWGWTPFDSEGILGKNTTLVNAGVVNSYIHSRETAQKYNVSPTGNGRQQNVENKIIPRMTNTYVGKGECSKDEILETIKEGYYLIGSMGGQVDPASGEFLFNAQEAFRIEKGEIKERLKEVSLTGNVLKSLNQISMIGNDLEIGGTGYCGKSGQYVPVGDGGPHFKFKKIKIGGKN